jgi:SMP-30/Gluconolactonase/LRE-like region
MKSHHWIALTLSLNLLTACAHLPKPTTHVAYTSIPVAAGPEDIVLDTKSTQTRILISCSAHRMATGRPEGQILAYTPAFNRVDTLTRTGAPAGQVFHPHGFDLVEVGGEQRLYIVIHDKEKQQHWIAQYKVEGDVLRWQRDYQSPLLVSPNAVTVAPDGTVYVSNDHRKPGSFGELLFRRKVSTLVRCTAGGDCTVAADRIAFGNGVTLGPDALYQAATTGNRVYRYPLLSDGQLGPRTVIAKLVGPDNLRWDGDSLLVACHLRGLAFMRHAKDASKWSPSAVYRISPNGGKPNLVFFDSGGRISAASTALMQDGTLYVSQVFGGTILRVD